MKIKIVKKPYPKMIRLGENWIILPRNPVFKIINKGNYMIYFK